jgi:hypothetical protein
MVFGAASATFWTDVVSSWTLCPVLRHAAWMPFFREAAKSERNSWFFQAQRHAGFEKLGHPLRLDERPELVQGAIVWEQLVDSVAPVNVVALANHFDLSWTVKVKPCIASESRHPRRFQHMHARSIFSTHCPFSIPRV